MIKSKGYIIAMCSTFCFGIISNGLGSLLGSLYKPLRHITPQIGLFFLNISWILITIFVGKILIDKYVVKKR